VYSSVDFVIQPSPRWVVEPEATDENWNSDIMSYSTLNTRIYRRSQGTFPMVNISNYKDLDAKYGMSVEVAAPIRRVCFYQVYSLNTDI
jgi:hypothetical protein